VPEEWRPNIPVLLGTIRVGRRSGHAARLLVSELENRGGIDTALIDLADFDLPVMRNRLGDTDTPPPGLTEFSAKVTRADGLVIVAPEYKNGYPGALKNALDYLAAGIFRRKPIGILTVSSGGFGGLNCLAQLRLVCLAMGACRFRRRSPFRGLMRLSTNGEIPVTSGLPNVSADSSTRWCGTHTRSRASDREEASLRLVEQGRSS
jgi:NAD(P)H-dependent FMN reductase